MDELENSNKKYTLTIKTPSFELSTTQTLEELLEQVDEILNFIETISPKLDTEIDIAEVLPTEEEIETASVSEVPVFKASRSTTENLRTLFSTEWGRTPRSLAEIVKALEVNAVPDKSSSVNTYLRRLIQRGELRRIKRDNLYHYIGLPPE